MSKKWQVAADDLSVMWKQYEERLAGIDTPRRRQVLGTLIEHLRTEASSDLEGVMRTVSPRAAFRHPDGTGPKGLAEIRSFYEATFASGGIGNMAVDTHRIVVDDDAIVNEYTLTMLLPWQLAKQQGYVIADESGHYAVRRRLCTMLPFDEDGLMLGEITYSCDVDPHDCERVPDDQLSPGYLQWLSNVPSQ